MLKKIVKNASATARKKRAALFGQHFPLSEDTKLLDIGSETGANISNVVRGTPIKPENVYIADIDAEFVREGNERFGFTPVTIPESGRLPFDDGFFDIVYCSSVIEHVTVPKAEVWTLRSGREFKQKAWARQQEFADEIIRLGKGYFVQTPNRWFLVESHSWLPFVGFLPRELLIPVLKMSNQVWIKHTAPDWSLLTQREMSRLFPGSSIVSERVAGTVKSVMAIKPVDGL